ncbi:MAG: hypothetical protein DRN12_08115 [Thermoplasmata archaeon]|nr:MAG: hypothetical protein DRN12_08115 [Thermoplasmata archaeon]
MVLITLIGKKLAKVGDEFIYLGITQKCKNCRLKTVCSNLQEGRTYKIVKIREKSHNCKLHDEGVIVVEVEKLPAEVNIKEKEAEATAVNYRSIKCNNVLCEEFEACTPKIKEKEYKIVEVIGDVECPKGYKLKKVLIDDIK